jgi:hypothetical protein
MCDISRCVSSRGRVANESYFETFALRLFKILNVSSGASVRGYSLHVNVMVQARYSVQLT